MDEKLPSREKVAEALKRVRLEKRNKEPMFMEQCLFDIVEMWLSGRLVEPMSATDICKEIALVYGRTEHNKKTLDSELVLDIAQALIGHIGKPVEINGELLEACKLLLSDMQTICKQVPYPVQTPSMRKAKQAIARVESK